MKILMQYIELVARRQNCWIKSLENAVASMLSYAEDRQACYHTDGVVLCVGGGCFGLSRFGNCELI